MSLQSTIEQLELDTVVLGNPLWSWGAAALTILLVWSALGLISRFLRTRTGSRVPDDRRGVVGAVHALARHTHGWFLFAIALATATRWLTLSERLSATLGGVITVALWLQVGLWAASLLRHVLERNLRPKAESDPSALTTLMAVRFVGHLGLWSAIALLALENLGVDVTALVAGLGIGGVAVALAAQNILGDLFASLSILLDRPFEVGDFIIVGDMLGTVEKIGLKTTRVRSLSGEQLVFGNHDLLSSRIRNYKRMTERRVVFHFGVVYQTPHAEIREIPQLVRRIIEKQSQVRFDRAHFQKYGESSLDFEVVYYVLVPDYNRYMDIQQTINLALYEQFEERGISFAYPTRTLFVQMQAEGTHGGDSQPTSLGPQSNSELAAD